MQDHWPHILCLPKEPAEGDGEVRVWHSDGFGGRYLGLLEEFELDAGLADSDLSFFRNDSTE